MLLTVATRIEFYDYGKNHSERKVKEAIFRQIKTNRICYQQTYTKGNSQ